MLFVGIQWHVLKRRIIILILLSLFSLMSVAQSPIWYDDAQRKTAYPVTQYFTGIAYGEIGRTESVESAINRVKVAARVEAVSAIQVHVKSETYSTLHDEMHETLDSWVENIQQIFDSKTALEVDLNISGLQIEAWRNPENSEVVAFAYIKKSILCRQMDKQIIVNIARIETIMDNTEQLIRTGQKIQARETIMTAVPLFAEVEKAQRILIATDPLSDAESLQLAESTKIAQRYVRIVSQLKNGINIYLSCKADVFGKNYPALEEKIKGVLSKLECNYVSTIQQADWAIYVKTTISKRNMINHGSTTDYFCYVTSTITIENLLTKQQIYENRLSEEKGSHTKDFEQAACDAYENACPRICEVIEHQLVNYMKSK